MPIQSIVAARSFTSPPPNFPNWKRTMPKPSPINAGNTWPSQFTGTSVDAAQATNSTTRATTSRFGILSQRKSVMAQATSNRQYRAANESANRLADAIIACGLQRAKQVLPTAPGSPRPADDRPD